MDVVGVTEAAERLGVSPSAVYQLLDTGQLQGLQVAGRLAIPLTEVQRLERLPRPTGRPFSAHSAWLIIRTLSSDTEPSDLSPSRRSQLRRHLLTMDTDELVGRLRSRADRMLFYVHPGLLEKVLLDGDALVTGERAAASSPAFDLIGSDADRGELYVRASRLPDFCERYHLVSDSEVTTLVVRVVPEAAEELLTWRGGTAPEAAVALDAAESPRARVTSAGWARLRELHAEYRSAGRPGATTRG